MERRSNIGFEHWPDEAELRAVESFRLALTIDTDTLSGITCVAPDALEWQKCNFGFEVEEGGPLIKSPEDLIGALRQAIIFFRSDDNRIAMLSLIENQASLLGLLELAFPNGELSSDTRMAIDEAWEEFRQAARWVDGTED